MLVIISKVYFGRYFLLEILASILFLFKVLTLKFWISSDYMLEAYLSKSLKYNLDSEGIYMLQEKHKYIGLFC